MNVTLKQQILDLFRKDIYLESSILQIARMLGKKGYVRVFNEVKRLAKLSILKVKKVGNINLVSLNLAPQAIVELSYLDELEAAKLPNYQKLAELTWNYVVIVTGSYAKHKQKKTSDLDVVVIIPDSEQPIHVQKQLQTQTLIFHPQVHLYVFTKSDFLQMLSDTKENYGKEIFRNHIILRNAEMYYYLLRDFQRNKL